MFGVFFVSPKGNELRSTAFLDDEFPREEGLFGPIEAATEFDAASYFARSQSVSLFPATTRSMALTVENLKFAALHVSFDEAYVHKTEIIEPAHLDVMGFDIIKLRVRPLQATGKVENHSLV